MPSIDHAVVARGRSHAHTGVGAQVVGTLILSVVLIVSPDPAERMGLAELVGSLLAQALLAAGVLASSRVARVLTAVSGGILLVLAVLLAIADVLLPDFPRHMRLPVPALSVGMLLIGAGSLLSTVTGPARAWHHAQRAARAARREATSLADWRQSSE